VTRRRIPDDVLSAAHARATARAAGEWDEADRLRAEIEAAGWKIADRGTDFALTPAAPPDVAEGERIRYGSSASVPARWDEPATGLATIEPELEDVLKALGASKLDIMRKVGIPRALPYFFGSLKVAITLAFVGAVISESVASNVGIGNLMLQAQAQFQVPLIFAGLLALAVEGIVMYALMAALEARMTGWAQRSGFAQA